MEDLYTRPNLPQKDPNTEILNLGINPKTDKSPETLDPSPYALEVF